ncbi:hypothetical protein FSP39_001965 [Pinctada imbricata]|uniref:NADAR domain-containing protein n=1 Tax=Pinctada imbricata TaxID=66713 RepID=A0AA89BNA2_PINIB|nr:hypothetical protein FSP39_001965 [Pinctada imbricata]
MDVNEEKMEENLQASASSQSHQDFDKNIKDSSIPMADTEESPCLKDTNSSLPQKDHADSEVSSSKTEEGDKWELKGESGINMTDVVKESVHEEEKIDDTHQNKNEIDCNDDENDNDKSDSEFKNSFSRSSDDKQTNSGVKQDNPDGNRNSKGAEAQDVSGKAKKNKKSRKHRFNLGNCFGGNVSNSDCESEEEVPKELIEKFKDDKESDFEYFWQSYSPFSQWYKATMTIDGTEYNCAEQYMMQQKALLMEDIENAGLIMALDEPREQKSVGREVKNWDQDLWNDNCWAIVRKGNLEKILVEASPYDKVWGIGLKADDWKAHNRAYWKGENRLGYILTEVRDQLMQERGMLDGNIQTVMLSDNHEHILKDENSAAAKTVPVGDQEQSGNTNITQGNITHDNITHEISGKPVSAGYKDNDQDMSENMHNIDVDDGKPDIDNHVINDGDIEAGGASGQGEEKVEDEAKVKTKSTNNLEIEPQTIGTDVGDINECLETKL